jgi:hypothetical protein
MFLKRTNGQQTCGEMINITSHQENGNEICNESLSHLRTPLIQKQKMTSAGEDIWEGTLTYYVWES